MVNTIIAHVNDDAIAQSLADCEIGEEKTVTLKVTDKGPGRLTGTVSDVEGYASAENAENEYPEMRNRGQQGDAMREGMASGKRVPKAIVMIGMGKR